MTAREQDRPILTDDARAALDEILNRQREEVIREAARRGGGPLDAVDVLRAYTETTGAQSAPLNLEAEDLVAQSERRLTLQIQVGQATVLVVAASAAAASLLGLFADSGRVSEPWISILATITSAAMAAATVVWFLAVSASNKRRERETLDRLSTVRALSRDYAYGSEVAALAGPSIDEEIAEAEEAAITRYTFLARWIGIEKQLLQLAEITLGGKDASRPIPSVVQSLVHDHVISEDTEFRIKRVLNSRNEVVHREHPRLDWSRLEYDMKKIETELNDAIRGARARRRLPRPASASD